MNPRRTSALVSTAALLAAVAGCGASTTTSTKGSTTSPATTAAAASPSAGAAAVQVVAAENFWGDIVRQIGGEHVQVTSIISDPEADPHMYETDPKTAAAIDGASFVVLNGAGYDDFAAKLLDASPSSKRTVLSVDQVVGATGDDVNPHLWYSPDYVKQAADAMVGALSKVDAADAAAFAANEKTFLAAYQPYVDTLATIKAKYTGAKIAYTERVPGYLVDAAGLVLGTPASYSQALEDGQDPSAADAQAIDDAMTNKTVKVLFYNSQVTDETTQKVQDLAKGSGVPVVGVSETVPADEPTFQAWQIDQAKALLAALGG